MRSIGRRDVLNVIDAMVERGAPVQANRQFAAMRKLFGWAVERGILETSPMATLRPPSPEVARDRVLTDAELRAVWLAAAEIGYPFGHSVQLLILTGQRRAEVLEAEWREFDLEGGMWTIPRQRAKNDRSHAVALSEQAVSILSALPRIGQPARFLFTTTGTTPFSGVSKATERLSSLAAGKMPDGQVLEPWRLHDLRRTFASGCARLGVGIHVVEKILNHTSGTFGGIVGVYQRHDFANERRQALDVWAKHLSDLSVSARSKVDVR
ncbi:integrase [Methylobacterium sp. OAE515]